MERPTPDRVVDARGTFCPVPIVETAKAAKELGPGQVLLVLATDPGVESDLQYWCKSTKNEYLGVDREGAEFRAWVRLGGGR
jgi:tRNA 2-thiouridine synthesizing protein A